MSDDGDLLPVQEWQMKRPSVLAALNNEYERGQVELCGLLSSTVKYLHILFYKLSQTVIH